MGFRRRGDGFHEGFSLSRLLEKPLSIFRRGGDDQIGQHKPWYSKLLGLLWAPFYYLYQVLFFIVVSWSSSRRGWGFVIGIPVILAILGVSGVVIWATYMEKSSVLRMHLNQAREAMIDGEYERADVAWRRALNILEENEYKYGYAASLFESGKKDRALIYMQYLAPADRAGYGTAHYWMGEQFLRNADWDFTKEERLAEAKRHYGYYNELALANQTDIEQLDFYALKFLADIHKEEGSLDLAIPIYERIMDRIPSVAPDVAEHYNDQGRIEDAKRLIEKTVERLWQFASVDPEQPIIWTTMYRILMVNSEFDKLMDQLENGRGVVRTQRSKAVIDRLMSDAHVEFANDTGEEVSLDNYRRKVLSISRAITRFPANVNAVEAALKLIVYPEHEEYEQWAEEEIRSNTVPWMGHVYLGIQDCLAGDPTAAKNHFQIADNLTKREDVQPIPHIINNFAWVMGSDIFDKPEDSLNLIDVGIDSFPSMVKFYQSRGEALLRLERYEEALEELEYASESIEDDNRIHEMMADCLEKLDRPDEAEAHRQIAEELREKRRLEMEERGRQEDDEE